MCLFLNYRIILKTNNKNKLLVIVLNNFQIEFHFLRTFHFLIVTPL